MPEVCIYTRISDDPHAETDGGGLGVARQEKECRALAKRMGWRVESPDDVYCDNDVSAYSGKRRPRFEAMLAAIARGQYDALLCWHPDRLYRSMKDLERIIDVCDTAQVPIRTVTGGDLDLSTASGKMLARILGSVSRQESEHKAERVRAKRLEQAEAGVWHTNCRTFGYTTKGELDPAETELVRKAAEELLNGRSASSIIREWNANGVTTARGNQWILTTFRRLFTNPRYAGLVEYKGRILDAPAQWPAIITTDEHAGLVAVFNEKAKAHKGGSWERRWIGTRRYLCGLCGAYMEHFSNKGAHAYRCTAARHLSRQQPALDSYVEGIALGFMRDEGKVAALMAAAAKARDGSDVNKMRAQRAALQAKKDGLAALYADGVLDSVVAVRREAAKLSDRIAALDSALADIARRSPLTEMVAEGVAQLDQRWADASPDIRGKVIDELFTVVINPVPKGHAGRAGFMPQYIDIRWHAAAQAVAS